MKEEETMLYAIANDLRGFQYKHGTTQNRLSVWETLSWSVGTLPRSFLLTMTSVGHGCHEPHFREKTFSGESRDGLRNQKSPYVMVVPNCGSRVFQIEFIPERWVAGSI
jgi:hypothetical protein